MKASFLKKLIKISNQPILLPFYHMVSDDKTFAKYLYSPRKIEVFKKDLEVLLKYYQPVSLKEFIKISQQKIKTTKPIFHLTFDDGLSNIFNIVAPILEEKKIPATFFVNSDFVDNNELFYRYKASLLIQFYEKSNKITQQKFEQFFNKKESIKQLLLSIKYTNRSLLDGLAKEVNFSFDEFLKTTKPYLTKNQIKDLINRGFTIGAHSKNHPLYSGINLQEQIKQTEESLNFIKTNFNVDYKSFSFPFTDLGVSKDFFTKIQPELDISFGISGFKNDVISTNFQRISLETKEEDLECFLIKMYFRYLLKIPFRKHIMPRN